MYYKLSKNGCSECAKLNGFLSTTKFSGVKEKITVVHKEENLERYLELAAMAAEQGYNSLPILMKDDKVIMSGFEPTKAFSIIQSILDGE